MGGMQGTTLYGKRHSSPPEAARGAALCVQCILYNCKCCAMRGIGVGGEHGQGRSQDDIGMGGAKKYGLPVAVILGVETSGLPPLATDLSGATAPQGPSPLALLVHCAREQAVSVP